MSDDHDPAAVILNRMLQWNEKRENIKKPPGGVSIHVVERCRTFGKATSLEGYILVETTDGIIKRANGDQLSALNEIAPEFLRHWRLPEDD